MGEHQNQGEPPERVQWLWVGVGLTALLAIVAIMVSLFGLASMSQANTTTVVSTATPVTPSPAATPAPVSINLTVKSDTERGKKGPDGKWHDAFLGGDFTVKAGQTVNVMVMNYDDSAHTFTAPSLGVNIKIPGGSETKPDMVMFTFKAPSKPGSYEWFCAMPCDPWAMAHDGYMRGHVTVTA